MTRSILLAVALLQLVLTGRAVHAEMPPPPAKCTGCHVPGESREAVFGPQLAGLSADYIVEQMDNFRQGKRGPGNPLAIVMERIAVGVDAQDIRPMAEWFAAQEPQPLPHVDDPGVPDQKAAKLYKDRCHGCHDSRMGRYFTDSPSLDHLHAAYILEQLRLFAGGQRGFVEAGKHKEKMLKIASELSSGDFELLARYLEQRAR